MAVGTGVGDAVGVVGTDVGALDGAGVGGGVGGVGVGVVVVYTPGAVGDVVVPVVRIVSQCLSLVSIMPHTSPYVEI